MITVAPRPVSSSVEEYAALGLTDVFVHRCYRSGLIEDRRAPRDRVQGNYHAEARLPIDAKVLRNLAALHHAGESGDLLRLVSEAIYAYPGHLGALLVIDGRPHSFGTWEDAVATLAVAAGAADPPYMVRLVEILP